MPSCLFGAEKIGCKTFQRKTPGSATVRAITMIVGYVLIEGRLCPSCWRRRKRPRPNGQLKRERNEPDDAEVMVAACSVCGQEIKYTSLVLLD